jgi:orotate phosphoribosyltransferase-like protein
MIKDEPEKIKTIIELYKEGKTYQEIAKKVNYSSTNIIYFIQKNLKKYNLIAREKKSIYFLNKNKIIELYNKGLTYPLISKETRINITGLKDFIYRRLILKNLVEPRKTTRSPKK